MTDLIFATILSFIVMSGVYVYAIGRGGITRRNLKDWGFALVLICLFALFALVNFARADEWRTLEYTEAYLGIDWQLRDDNPQCYPDGTDDRITSHGGLTQHLIGIGAADLELVYTHHSCAINSDRFVYDGLGVRVTYKIHW
jgi:hypothetical protein